MSLTLHVVSNSKELHTYIHLPTRIHRGHSNWLPPLYLDEQAYYDPKKNKAFSYCDTRLWLALRNGEPVGRVMGIIHHPYNEKMKEKTVRFAHLDCFDDAEAVGALLNAVEQWGFERGMHQIVGPFGFSDKDPEGLQIEGFDELPVLVTPCNLPYLPRHVERAGFEKLVDCVDYLIDINRELPDFFHRIYERVKQNSSFQLLEFQRTRELRPYIVPVFRLINKTYTDLYGFVPLDEQEMKEMADRYLPLLNPRFVKVVLDPDGELAAFIVAMPNMTRGIQRSGGKLFPLGLLHILWAAKTTRQLDLMLGAIDERYRGKGLDILMGWRLIQSARAAGMQRMESHLILETNTRMRAECERLGARLHKRFRIYQKQRK